MREYIIIIHSRAPWQSVSGGRRTTVDVNSPSRAFGSRVLSGASEGAPTSSDTGFLLPARTPGVWFIIETRSPRELQSAETGFTRARSYLMLIRNMTRTRCAPLARRAHRGAPQQGLPENSELAQRMRVIVPMFAQDELNRSKQGKKSRICGEYNYGSGDYGQHRVIHEGEVQKVLRAGSSVFACEHGRAFHVTMPGHIGRAVITACPPSTHKRSSTYIFK